MTSQRPTADARGSGPRRAVAGLLLLGCASLVFPVPAHAEPKLISIFPLGGQRGTTVEAEIQGTGLEGTHSVWLGPGSQLEGVPGTAAQPPRRTTKGPHGLNARVTASPGGSRATVQLTIASEARTGLHSLSLISPAGVSRALAFWVGPHAVIDEASVPHDSPQTAQPLTVPAAVNGRIKHSGQLAYYSFDVAREQSMVFEVVAQQGADFDPQLALYEAGGSFLDPGRSKRLLFREEITQGGMPADRRMTCHFTKPGRYLLSLANAFAQGGAGATYLLRLAPDEGPAAAEDALSWGRRRLQELGARSLGAPAPDVRLIKDAESNDRPENAQPCGVPAVLAGAVSRPGDIDFFKFKAQAGQKLALELCTPRAAVPRFNVRLDVLDAQGTVVLSNLEVHDAKVGTVDTKALRLAPLLTGALAQAGEYCLRVRGLSSIHGGADHAYWVLLRPQVPHVEVKLQPDGPVNLHAGGKQRLAITLSAAEGYAGGTALSVEGLPPGVRAFVGANNSLIEFVAEAGAARTALPHVVRIAGLPLEGGKSGSAFSVAEVPLMVVGK